MEGDVAHAAAAAVLECEPGHAVNRALLPEIEAAVAFLRDELVELRLGKLDDKLHELLEGPPLPADRFETLLSVWKVPAVPAELTDMVKSLAQLQRRDRTGESAYEDAPAVAADTDTIMDECDARSTESTTDGDRARIDSTAARDNTGDNDADKAGHETVASPLRSCRTRKSRGQRAADDDDTNDTHAEIDLTRSAESDGDASTPQVMTATGGSSSSSVTQNASRRVSDAADSSPSSRSASTPAVGEDAETALAGLRSLRKGMLLDVLSKIISVAKTKGVDPAMLTHDARVRDATAPSACLDLEMVATAIARGAIAEWEDFARHVYRFCEYVIADAETRAQPSAKQKGVELLHFARTLTETLRKASAKREQALLGECNARPQQQQQQQQQVVVVAAAQAEVEGDAPGRGGDDDDVNSADGNDHASGTADMVSDGKAVPPLPTTKTPPPPAHSSPSTRRLSIDPLTPNRISARIRQRGSSFSDPAIIGAGAPAATPQSATATPTREDEPAASEVGELRGSKKRPRASSTASSATPPPPTASTASEDDAMSESESQVSATSEAETHQQKRRGSASRTTAQPAAATPVTRTRTRARRPVVPATRASSRQQKRRAQRAAATDDDRDGSDNAAAVGGGGGDDDTAQGEDDDDDGTNQSDSAVAAEPDATPAVPLTKAGRPRKKPGRKPAGYKKNDAK